MVEVEVLFSSGQGILLHLEDREAALQLMKRVMDTHNDASGQSLFHLSTDYEELLIDLADISFVRVKKEHHPLLTTKLRLNAGQPETTVHTQAHRSDEAIPMPPKSEPTSEAPPDNKSEAKPKDESKKDPSKGESEALSKAQERLSQAEAQLRKVEEQRKKVEDQIRKQNEILEDEVREAQLKKKIEDVEIGNEIDRMKGKLDK